MIRKSRKRRGRETIRRKTTRVEYWPRLTRFYGISPVELQHWPRWLIELYVTELEVIEAREEIRAYGISAYPHLKDEDRMKLFRATCRTADIDINAVEPEQTVDPTTEGGAAMLGGLGILVVTDDA